MFDEIKRRTTQLLKAEAGARGGKRKSYFLDIPDTHSVAIVASHWGKPIREIEVRRYEVFDQEPMVNREPLERYKEAIGKVVALL